MSPARPNVSRLVRDWLEDRTGLPSALDRALDEPIPGGARLWHALGATAAFLVLMEFVTGMFLAFYYSPSASWPQATIRSVVSVSSRCSVTRFAFAS